MKDHLEWVTTLEYFGSEKTALHKALQMKQYLQNADWANQEIITSKNGAVRLVQQVPKGNHDPLLLQLKCTPHTSQVLPVVWKRFRDPL